TAIMRVIGPPRATSSFRRAAATLAVVLTPTLAAAQQATIAGRVTAQGTGEALSDVRVYLVGSTLATATNAEGRYTLRGVPAGVAEVRVIRVGFQEQKKPITVVAGATDTLNFTMQQAVIQLQDVVTTATGDQRKVELGNTIATLGDISKRVEEAPITSIGDLLVAKAPGVVVLPGSMTGTAPSIRI